ncbi:MAG: SDR family oxidoreductase [Sinimarinibacterium flocculans]|uniref:SDR family oxidoreductase n=1 Tax=Sinimarinibacterium flocculans TaxID=985250 RepID=UPI003C39098D
MRFRTMKNITVITGGAGGMGLATARILGRDHRVLICDVRQERLDAALAELRAQGIDGDAAVCDITDPSAVDTLLQRAAQSGTLAAVVHTAGLSPQMAEPETIMKVNALGTVNVMEACLGHARDGFALVNVASMAAHMMPSLLCPTRAYPLALSDTDTFLRRAVRRANLMPTAFYRRGMAYGISKHFVIWLSRHSAGRFGEKGARVLSVSPGSFDTEMGRLEEKSGSAEMLRTAALKRFGTPAEIAEVLAFCASSKAGYLTGTDILCDGGVLAGRRG